MPNAETARLIAVLELKDLFSDKISKAERSLGKFESRSTKAGRQIGLGILRGAAVATAGVGAFTAVFAKGLGAASDLNETVSKTGVVFGKNAKQVLAFGHDSAAAMGLSENAALAAASTYGNLFVSLGLTTTKAATMSTTMVKLAGDLASFNNASPEDTLLAIQAGLVGETEPLRRYGINLNDATLRQEAMRLGLTKTTKEVLPPAIKAQAAYSLILKQSGTAQGDFQRTSGGMANQIRILKANFTDMLATLAAPALPGVAKIFQNLNKEIKANQPAIAALGEKIGGLFTDDNIKSGFNAIKQGFQIAKDAAPAIADAAKITGAALKIAVDAFKSLPKEVQQIAIAGLAVNKLTGGLVTNIAGGIIDTVGKQFLQRGGTPANPLFVLDVAGGGAVGAAAGITKAGLVAAGTTLLTTVAIPAVIGLFLAGKLAGVGPFQDEHPMNVKTFDHKTAPTGPSSPEDRDNLSLKKLNEGGSRDISEFVDTSKHLFSKMVSASTLEFRKITASLRNARGGKEVAAAIKASLGEIFKKGLGGSGGAENTLKALRAQLKNTHDPALQRTLQAAIGKVEHKLAARRVVEAQLKKADDIFKSNKTNAQKIVELKHVQQVIGGRNAIATKRVQDKIDAAKRAQVAAADRTAAAVRRKKLSITNNLTIPVSNNVSVDSRAVVRTNTTFHKYFPTATSKVQE